MFNFYGTYNFCQSINRLFILVTFGELKYSFKKRRYVRANLKLAYIIENYVFLYIQQLDLS